MYKFAYFGAPDISRITVNRLAQSGMTPEFIVTLPDAPSGRGRALKATPLKLWGKENKIKVIEWQSAKQVLDELKKHNLDFVLVFAFGKILPKEMLNLPNIEMGFINIHPSLLPKLRGPSPIRSAIMLNQRQNVGVSIIKMNEKMDAGDIIFSKKAGLKQWPIPGRKLDVILAQISADILIENLQHLHKLISNAVPQNDKNASYTTFLTKQMCEIPINAIDKEGKITSKYAYLACACDENPAPYFFVGKKRIKIQDLAGKEDGVYIETVTPEGKKPVAWQEFKNGFLRQRLPN